MLMGGVALENINTVISILNKHHVSYTIIGRVDKHEKDVLLETENGKICLPRYGDDKVDCRGSIDAWSNTILPLL